VNCLKEQQTRSNIPYKSELYSAHRELDSDQFTYTWSSKLIIIKASKTARWKKKTWWCCKADSKGYNLYFTNFFQFQHLLGQNGLSIEVWKSGALRQNFTREFTRPLLKWGATGEKPKSKNCD